MLFLVPLSLTPRHTHTHTSSGFSFCLFHSQFRFLCYCCRLLWFLTTSVNAISAVKKGVRAIEAKKRAVGDARRRAFAHLDAQIQSYRQTIVGLQREKAALNRQLRASRSLPVRFFSFPGLACP